MKAIIDRDGDTTTVFHSEDGKHFIETRQDVGDIIERNHAFRTEGQRSDSVLGKKVAEIPASVQMEWCRLAGVRFVDFLRWPAREKRKFCVKFLRDPDWAKLRATDYL